MRCCDVEEMDCYDCQIEPPKEIEVDVVPVEGQQGPKGDKGEKGDKGDTDDVKTIIEGVFVISEDIAR